MADILPAIFFGHGNPMHAVLDNVFTVPSITAPSARFTPKLVAARYLNYRSLGQAGSCPPVPVRRA